MIARLLNAPLVLATGGGAFIDTATRELIKQRGSPIWLRADLDLLDKRTRGREDGRYCKRIVPERPSPP